jgi:hypothetical protein
MSVLLFACDDTSSDTSQPQNEAQVQNNSSDDTPSDTKTKNEKPKNKPKKDKDTKKKSKKDKAKEDASVLTDLFGGGSTKKEYKAKCKTYNYSELRQYPDRFKNKYIKLTGIIESTKTAPLGLYHWLLVNSGNNYYELKINVLNADYDDYIEGNKIRIWGQCKGNAKYRINGSKTTVPSIKVKYDKLWYRK